MSFIEAISLVTGTVVSLISILIFIMSVISKFYFPRADGMVLQESMKNIVLKLDEIKRLVESK